MVFNITDTADVVRVGIAEGAVVREPLRIRTTGLGSCVGVVIYDKKCGYAGLVHVMLPTAPGDASFSVSKYADSGIPWLVDKLIAHGCRSTRLQAKIAGGAQMFSSAAKTDVMRVGPRNIEACQNTLMILKIPIVSADVGGNVGRTIEFDLMTEQLMIKTALKGTYTI